MGSSVHASRRAPTNRKVTRRLRLIPGSGIVTATKHSHAPAKHPAIVDTDTQFGRPSCRCVSQVRNSDRADSAPAQERACGGGALLGLLVAVMAGCAAAPPSSPGVASVREGVVESVAQVAPRRVGALTGMLVGGVIGNRECGAENRMVGLALGALGGAWAVNSSGLDPRSQGYRVTVRLDDGGVEHFQNSDPVSITVGQRVMMAGHKLVRSSALSGDASPGSSPTL